MKSLVRWSATLGLVGTTLLGSFLGGNLRALALTEQQVMEKLQTVPVFTVTDGEGSPLVASIPSQNNQNEAVAGVFISQRDAEAFVERLKREKPELGNQVRVVPVSLAEVYQLDQQSQNQPNGLDFAYIPVQQQVQSAQQLLGQGQEFRGVPLFVAKGGQQGGYLTIQQEGQQVIPFFFDKEQLQNLVNRFKEQQPNLASSVQIQVVPLEGIINTLQTQDNPQLEQILLIPSQESLQFLRQSSSQ
ncbi:Tic22-like family [Coleofasciculus chthonoplastes PCC 7420]|uniref:Tic22-like family n=1 Tax=Coleofasciculus chthonoplastes PCC 7420 TaxID=118168 RepID=B4VYI2_9CYAN|nr:Tic22 family protein [Coleofasciculus chthonoplastes]EDX72959.1 Tic22-like family [Coleofasciculus chthonoplastes PCC 7420]